MGRKQKNDKTERARGLGLKTSERIGKGNQMTALRFQTGEDIRYPRPLNGGQNNEKSAIADSRPSMQIYLLTYCGQAFAYRRSKEY